MINIRILHIFLILLVLKLLSIYVDYKFTYIVVIISIFLFYLYSNNKLSFDFTNIVEKINNDPLYAFKHKINNLSVLVNQLNSFDDTYFGGTPTDNKQKLISRMHLFIDNSLSLYKNLRRNCGNYIDIIHSQRINIYNDINSFIVTMPSYEKYDLYKHTMNNIIKITDDIFNMVSNKCSQQYVTNNIPYNFDKYNIKQPSAPRKDFEIIDNLKYQYSNSNSYEQYKTIYFIIFINFINFIDFIDFV